MPTVGKKKFAYTAKGEAKAKVFAKKTGRKVVISKSLAGKKAKAGKL